MAPEAVEHAYGKCIEALDRVPRPTRLALLQWSLAPALRDIVRIRNMCCLTSEGELDFSGFARTHQLALRVFLCVEALGRIDWTAPNDEAVTAAAALLHYDVSEVVDPSWPINSLKFTTAFCTRPRMCEFVTPAAAEHCNAEYAPGIVLELTTQIASVAAVAEIALTAIVLREVAEVAHPGGDFWTKRLGLGQHQRRREPPVPDLRRKARPAHHGTGPRWVLRVQAGDGGRRARVALCLVRLPVQRGRTDAARATAARREQKRLRRGRGPVLRLQLCRDDPRGGGLRRLPGRRERLRRVLWLRAVAPRRGAVATAIFVDMQDDEIREKVVSEDPAFYGEMDRRGIRVFDMRRLPPTTRPPRVRLRVRKSNNENPSAARTH